MGIGGGMGFGPSISKPEPAKKVSPLENECGIKAVAKALDIDKKDMLTKIERDHKELYEELVKKFEKGLSYKDLVKVAVAISDLLPDMRFNYGGRIVDGYPFEDTRCGFTALKFTDGNYSHWLSIKDGNIVNGDAKYKTMAKLRRMFAKFDGFGHTVIFQTERNAGAIKNLHSVKCCGDCTLCFRKKFCREKMVQSIISGRPPRNINI